MLYALFWVIAPVSEFRRREITQKKAYKLHVIYSHHNKVKSLSYGDTADSGTALADLRLYVCIHIPFSLQFYSNVTCLKHISEGMHFMRCVVVVSKAWMKLPH